MKLVSSKQMREIDRKIISDFNVSGEVLMNIAGRGVAEVVRSLADLTGRRDSLVSLFAGHGNNGGDAYVAARYLRRWGFDVHVLLVGTVVSVKGDALMHLELMRSAGVEIHELLNDDMSNLRDLSYGSFGFVVDGLLGTGTVGAAREPIASVIRYINSIADRNIVVAIDVPSGLDADTGVAVGDAVFADVTATMGLPKSGLVVPSAVKYVGAVRVVDIGVPSELIADIGADVELVTATDLASFMPLRRRDSHKGDFGHLLIIAGSSGYSGAAVFAAGAAVRSGAGLVSVLTARDCVNTVVGLVPEAMVHAASGSDADRMGIDALGGFSRNLSEFDAVVIGPGLGTGSGSIELVEKVLRECSCPVVMDADALNVCCGQTDLIRSASSPIVITPHPGEMSRLFSCSTIDVQSDRIGMAEKAAAELDVVAVLKGAGTVVAELGKPVAVNLNGNPGMATGGMGDVLAGLIGGLLAQGCSAFDSARAGVYIHGSAGDRAAWLSSQAGLTASAVVNELPHIFKEFGIR